MKSVVSSDPVRIAPQDNKTVSNLDNFNCFKAGKVALLKGNASSDDDPRSLEEEVDDNGNGEYTDKHKVKNLFSAEKYGFVCTVVRIKASVNPPKIIDELLIGSKPIK
uniref:Uncharacterized protein n=2 Tax=Brassica oleracea TaxID=3712 RepID=A0A0D3AFA1_BRAOL|nr:unnamed protein product [Brassica oleracea]